MTIHKWVDIRPYPKLGTWHIVIVTEEPHGDDVEDYDALDYDIYHDGSCGFEVHFRPDNLVTYNCELQHELSNAGFDQMPKEPGVYRVRTWFDQIKGHEYTEYDAGLEVDRIGDWVS